MVAVIGAALVVSSGIAGARGKQQTAQAVQPSVRQQQFTAAAKESGVPEQLLLAVSYTLSRWEAGTQADSAGGFGPMGLTALDGRGYAQKVTVAGADPAAVAASVDADPSLHTLELAAAALKQPAGMVSRSPQLNIRAGAALLRKYAGASAPASLDGWHDAVVKYLGGGTATATAGALADDVYDTLRTGAARTTSDGMRMVLPAQTVAGRTASAASTAAQCPAGLSCRFVQATAHDAATRTAGQIRYIVIGSTGATYEQTVARAAAPDAYTSSHYVVRGADGAVTQLVKTSDVAWFSADQVADGGSISVALDSFTDQGYASAAKLIKQLAATYKVPLDRQHVLGRDELAAVPAPYSIPNAADPGLAFDWGRLFQLMGAQLAAPSDDFGQAVAFTPTYAKNLAPVTTCVAAVGVDCAKAANKPGNGVLLRTQPSDTAPLVSDPLLHPDGKPGSVDAADLGDRARAGQVFAVAERRNGWTAIWYGGQRAWYKEAPGLTRQVRTPLATPGAGVGEVAVYSRPGATVNEAYTIGAGQSYPLLGNLAGGWSVIAFNHQLAYVQTALLSVWPG